MFRRAAFRAGVSVVLLSAGLALAAPAARAASGAADDAARREPRLILPVGHVVESGRRIALTWTEADSVSELEILISTDGGRTYATCISPELDPRQHAFVWRVPPLGRGALMMRIRFNRGGREIEGAPVAVVAAIGDDGRSEPLALPPLSAGTARSSSAPGDRGAPQGGRSTAGMLRDASGSAAARAPIASRETRSALIDSARSIASALAARFAPPRSVPLRV